MAAEEYVAVQGVIPPVPDDQRRFVRSRLRVAAAMQYHRSPPALRRQKVWHKIVVRDISRSGIGFLHSEEVFCTEQLMLVLPDCKPGCIEVTRCRRLAESASKVGAIFIQGFRPQTAAEPSSSTGSCVALNGEPLPTSPDRVTQT